MVLSIMFSEALRGRGDLSDDQVPPQKIPRAVSPDVHVPSLWLVWLPMTPATGLIISPRGPGSPF